VEVAAFFFFLSAKGVGMVLPPRLEREPLLLFRIKQLFQNKTIILFYRIEKQNSTN
jgi:hypothetical protein